MKICVYGIACEICPKMQKGICPNGEEGCTHKITEHCKIKHYAVKKKLSYFFDCDEFPCKLSKFDNIRYGYCKYSACSDEKKIDLSVREMTESDIELIVNYFINSSPEFLQGMGANKKFLQSKADWRKKIENELHKKNEVKDFYYLIWLIDNKPIGHSNIANILFGKEAKMHLHLWSKDKRQKGLGQNFLKQTIPLFFSNFGLDILICEPYSLNIAPNILLKKMGFKYIKQYQVIIGGNNIPQIVNRYELSIKKYCKDIADGKYL